MPSESVNLKEIPLGKLWSSGQKMCDENGQLLVVVRQQGHIGDVFRNDTAGKYIAVLSDENHQTTAVVARLFDASQAFGIFNFHSNYEGQGHTEPFGCNSFYLVGKIDIGPFRNKVYYRRCHGPRKKKDFKTVLEGKKERERIPGQPLRVAWKIVFRDDNKNAVMQRSHVNESISLEAQNIISIQEAVCIYTPLTAS